MASRKKAAKKVAKKSAKKSAGVHLPEGYKVIERAPTWDCEKDPVLEGVRGEAKIRNFKRDGKSQATNYIVIEDDKLGPVTVFESAGLRDFFEQTKDGDTVRIEYIETMKPIKKGQQGMRVFSCAVKE
jgi:hypothetical protein